MLRTRLFFGLMPLVLILIGTGLYAIRQSRELANDLARDLAGSYQAIFALQQMRESTRLMYAALPAAATGDVPGGRRAFDEHRGAFARELIGQATHSAGTSRAELVAALDEAFRAFTAAAERSFTTAGTGSLAELRAREAAYFGVLKAIDVLTQHDSATAREITATVGVRAATTQRVLIAAITAAVLLSIFVSWRLRAAVLQPIKALTSSAVALGEGHLDVTVPEFSGDELGQLARAFNTMAARLREYREAMQARVLRTQRTMEATLTSTPDPVFVVDRAGAHTVRNPAAEDLAKAGEFDQGIPPGLAEPLATVLATGEHYLPTDYGRAVTLRRGREDRHYLPRILAIGDRLTEFNGAAVILQDVTKFRLLDDAKTNLVGTVSHELKTPLTSLRMAVYLLLEQEIAELTATQRELLETARDEADRLLRILNDLLDLARLEAGASALDRREVAVAEVVDGIAGEARGFIGAAGQTLRVIVAPELASANLALDPGRIRHVFMNLLTNAAKYSPPGGTIALSATGEPGFVRFAVRDQGSGIAAEDLPHVFDRFYRAPGQEKTTGAGLGLAIAREIVVAHGGSIGCTSEAGAGTEFWFLLPRGRE
jgi:signal transduction histidine kinase